MKISHKLVGSFIGLSLLTAGVGIVAIVQSKRIAETLAATEAERVAQTIALSIANSESKQEELSGNVHADQLQRYVLQMYELQHRDIEVVNRQTRIIADVISEDLGETLEINQSNEVRQTMKDGIARTYVEKSDDYPQGIEQIIVPLRNSQNITIGAVVLESLYNKAIAQAKPTLIVITLTSLGGVVIALIIGLQISNSISKPLQATTDVAQKVIQAFNFELRVPVTTTDEIGTLANALNNLIQQVNVLLNEKEHRSKELQQALTQLQATQIQLVQTEKMSSLGQLVAGVAHEINNPINFIHGNINYIENYTQDLLRVVQAYQTHYPSPPETLQATLEDVELDFVYEDLTKLLQSLRVGTNRIRQIVLSLRNFSRLDEAEFKAVDLHEGIDNTLLILQHRLQPNPESPRIEIYKEYGDLPLVECYPSQLNQVFMNLIVNAVDALQNADQLWRKNGRSDQLAKIKISTRKTADDSVQIVVSDNGPGIEETVRSRIFDPFFTTKPVGKGTGLGLSISYQIVAEKHGGKIWCDSTVEEGTQFVVEIPIHQRHTQLQSAQV